MSSAVAVKEEGQRRRPGLVRLEQRQVAHLDTVRGRGEGGEGLSGGLKYSLP